MTEATEVDDHRLNRPFVWTPIEDYEGQVCRWNSYYMEVRRSGRDVGNEYYMRQVYRNGLEISTDDDDLLDVAKRRCEEDARSHAEWWFKHGRVDEPRPELSMPESLVDRLLR